MEHDPDLYKQHARMFKSSVDLCTSSTHFQIAHQPCTETVAGGSCFAGSYPSSLCTCYTNTHPLTPEDLVEFVFVERISFALQALKHYLPLKAFCVPIFKKHKGKHRQFICLFCTDSEAIETTQKLLFMSQQATCVRKCLFNCFLCA